MTRRGAVRRSGAVLLLVLVLVPVLALGGYAFTHWMRAEARASVVALRQVKARWLADSGIDLALAYLSDPQNFEPGEIDWEDDSQRFAAQLIYEDANGLRGLVSLIVSAEDGSGVTYGMENQSAKIPLHNSQLVVKWKEDNQTLMRLPGMTETLADAIIDWIDADDTPQPQGVEADHYANLEPGYEPRNGTPKTLEELLLVDGVTPALLFGEDANRNGLLDANEDDGDDSWPPDNADGALDRGWYPFLTLHSGADANNPQGEPKFDLKQADSEEGQKKLAELFGNELAEFVAAYGASRIEKVSELIDATASSGDSESGDSEQEDGESNGNERGADDEDSSEGERSSGGGRPSGEAPFESPWTSDNLSQYFEKALEELAVGSDGAQGRIDVSRAPAGVLRTLPRMTDESADRIASAAANRAAGDRSPAWLLIDGHVDLEQFRAIEPFITVSNRVFRVEAIGYFEQGGPMARVEALIDASSSVPTVLFRRDLTPLGSGYAVGELLDSAP